MNYDKKKLGFSLPYGVHRGDDGTYWAPLGWKLEFLYSPSANKGAINWRYIMKRDIWRLR